MNRTILTMFALGCLLGFGVGTAQAGLITFDDLPSTGSAIPSGYGGLNWRNLQVVNIVRSGLVGASLPNAAITFEGGVTIAPAGPETFTFVGADFAGADNEVMITAQGLRGRNPVYNASFRIRPDIISFEMLNFQNIDTLVFSAIPLTFGGPADAKAAYLIDNFTTGPQRAPEPASWLLFGIGAAGAGLAALRRRRLNPVRIPGVAAS